LGKGKVVEGEEKISGKGEGKEREREGKEKERLAEVKTTGHQGR